MSKDVILLNAIIFFYVLQRISEMLISKKNEVWLKENCGAIEVNPSESLRMKVFHVLWFGSLILEANIKRDLFPGLGAIIIYSLLGTCLAVRFYSMEKLKSFWTIKIFSLKKQVLITDGLYRYVRHPNYLIVILEFILLPLLFKAYYTLLIFSFLNIFILKKRIELEENTLMAQSNYRNQFMNVRKLIPFFLLLILVSVINPLESAENTYHYNDYQEAKKSSKFIKFEGASTKLGLITTNFDGYIKDFKINFELVNDQLNALSVDIVTKSLDTNINSRNDKMFSSILDTEKYPGIKVVINEKLKLSEGDHTVNMTFTVKEKKVSKAVKFNVIKKSEGYLITGTTSLSLKELDLPDPSIIIAKVDDRFELNFSIIL